MGSPKWRHVHGCNWSQQTVVVTHHFQVVVNQSSMVKRNLMAATDLSTYGCTNGWATPSFISGGEGSERLFVC